MKVLFIIDSLANSGTEKSILEICKHFSTNTTPVLVYLHGPETLKLAYQEANIPLINLTDSRKSPFISQLFRLLKVIRNEKPDIMVSSLFKANQLARVASLINHKKLVGTFVSDSYNTIRTKNMNSKAKFGFALVKMFDRLTSFIPVGYISNSVSIKDSNCRALGIITNKVRVIYRGRNADLLKEWIKPITNSEVFIFCITARLLETKGYKELLKAFARLKKRYPNVLLNIYGDGILSQWVTSFCAENGLKDCVLQYGNLPDAWQYLYKSNCFVFPSWYEGISGSLIEAAIMGIPIIASDIPMNLEVIETIPNVLVHKLKDESDLEKQMEKMITNYETYIANTSLARERAMEKFDIRLISAQYETYLSSSLVVSYLD